jgi:acyl-CoA reductase-like NAD-dependent aldehyde dehydrogenase
MVQSGGAVVDRAGLDAVVADLRAGLPTWVSLPLAERIELLRVARGRVGREADGIVAAGCAAQGIAEDSRWAADLWADLSPLPGHLSAFEEVLARVAAGREPLAAGAVHIRQDGQVVVDVAPATRKEHLLLGAWGLRGQVWMQPGVDAVEVRASAARAYRGSGFDDPGVALVLGAGNAAFLPAGDILQMLIAQGCVVVVKLNPVNAFLRPFFERIFADFVERGWVRFVDGGAEVGQYLALHRGVDRVHMTGSAATYDALVWGVGDEAVRNRAAGRPLLVKPVSAELGGVSPMIVVPGSWSASDVRLQAGRITYAKLHNCGHICSAAQVLVLPEGWAQGDALLDEVRAMMRALPPRPPYYPGSAAKVARALAGQPRAEALLPPDRQWLVDGLDPDSDPSLFRDEVFADVLGVVRLPAPTVAGYLDAATDFANERLAGNLGATVLVDPGTARTEAAALDRAVRDLRYGAIGVNSWAVLAASLGYPTWGGFPGNTRENIGSGIGTMGNAFMLAEPQKSVVCAAFHPRIKPLDTASHLRQTALWQHLIQVQATEDLRAMPGLFAAALRG